MSVGRTQVHTEETGGFALELIRVHRDVSLVTTFAGFLPLGLVRLKVSISQERMRLT